MWAGLSEAIMAYKYSYPERSESKKDEKEPSRYTPSGETLRYSCKLSATPIIPSEGLDTPEGRVYPVGTINVPLILRAEPVQLDNGMYSEVKYINGSFTYGVVILTLIGSLILLPFALLALYPLCCSFGVKWMKDIKHVHPVTRKIIGIYYRGFQDAPSFYEYQNEKNQTTRITFGTRPVLLPDGHTTVTRTRIGARNFKYMMYLSILLFCLLFLYCIIGIPVIVLFGLLPPCLRDTEHIHPITGEVVGIYYHCVMVITRTYSYTVSSDGTGRGSYSYSVKFKQPTY